LVRFGLTPRIATERNEAGETRLEKIVELIRSSKYSIHDLSRSQAAVAGEHYRLNMPFELGIDFGCKRLGDGPLAEKKILVLQSQNYRHQVALSDLAGVDVEAHNGDYQRAVQKVRKWVAGLGGFERVGTKKILAEYEDFQEWYYERQLAEGFSEDDIQDYSTSELLAAMFEWVEQGRPRE
jgi:hypothetical protein